ncbi:MAG: hypothetical protein EXS36_13925 [Pedosphaera sp.]|nr:hypothetical protein [Pedosphaera sp.]
MTFERREGVEWVFRLKPRERELLLSVLGFRKHFPRQSLAISRDPDTATDLCEAGQDLNSSLAAHWGLVAKSVDRMLKDPVRCRGIDGGHELLMDSDQVHGLLQALNDVRLRAWEKLGRPDVETGVVLKIGSDNIVGLRVLQLTALFQGSLLEALDQNAS